MTDPRLTEGQTFLLLFNRALMAYGCPLRGAEDQVIKVTQFLEVNTETIPMPTALPYMFFDRLVKLS